MRPNPELKVETARVDELIPYAGNAKLHPRRQVDQIAASIAEFGNCDPIAVWHNAKGEMEIVEGHGRLMALNKLGIETCPVITLDHLSDEQRRAYALVHNQLTLNSGFDVEIVADEIGKIADIDMAEFGFDVTSASREFELEAEMSEDVDAEVPFSRWVDEASNYVVLTFRTEQDWLRAQSVLGLEVVKAHSTKRGGGGKLEYTGIGRVVDGVEAFRRIAEAEEELRR